MDRGIFQRQGNEGLVNSGMCGGDYVCQSEGWGWEACVCQGNNV